jgi:hypothetical protein
VEQYKSTKRKRKRASQNVADYEHRCDNRGLADRLRIELTRRGKRCSVARARRCCSRRFSDDFEKSRQGNDANKQTPYKGVGDEADEKLVAEKSKEYDVCPQR